MLAKSDAVACGQKQACKCLKNGTESALEHRYGHLHRWHVTLSGVMISCMMRVHGLPRYLRSENGPEFVSKALLEWAIKESLQLALIEPGKPWQNGTNESFNGKFRDECLSMEWFRNRLEAKVVIEDWRHHYNDVRPHASLNYQTPKEFKLSLANNLTTGANFSI